MTTVAPDAPPSFSIRQAQRADLLAVHRIEQASFPQPWPYSAFENYLDEPGFLVAEPVAETDLGEGVDGYVVADTVPNHGTPLGHVKDIAVHPDRRGQGVGTALLKRALAVLSGQGAGSVKLEVRESNDTAISLYRSFGFERRRTIPRYYGNGEDAFVMVRLLD
ncbi:MAG: ribosomal protein S18-alanine N-acetyltransferase [Haloarculaceae archaeon]